MTTTGDLQVCVGCSKPMRGNDEVVIASGPKTWASRMEKSTRKSEREQFTDNGQGRSCWGLDCFYRPVIDARALVVGHSSLLAPQVPRPSLPRTRVISAGAGQSRRAMEEAGRDLSDTLRPVSLSSFLNTTPLFGKFLSWSFCRDREALPPRGWQDGVRHPCGRLMAGLPSPGGFAPAVCTSVSNSTLDTGQQGRGTEKTTIRRELYGLRDG